MIRATAVIARLMALRVLRGRTKWITLILIALPALAALAGSLMGEHTEGWVAATQMGIRFVVPLAVALHLANGVGEEIESRTFTYLWSRPFPRPALLLGKLVMIVPVVGGLTALSLAAAYQLASAGEVPDAGGLLRVLLAALMGSAAAGAFAIGAGSLFPKNPLVFVLGYLLVGEQMLSFIPNVRHLSFVFHTEVLAGLPIEGGLDHDPTQSAVTLAALAAIWLGVGVWRVQTRELALPEG